MESEARVHGGCAYDLEVAEMESDVGVQRSERDDD